MLQFLWTINCICWFIGTFPPIYFSLEIDPVASSPVLLFVLGEEACCSVVDCLDERDLERLHEWSCLMAEEEDFRSFQF